MSSLIAEERRLLSEMDRYAALFPDRADGQRESTRVYLPKIEDVRIKRSRLSRQVREVEGDELQRARERLGLPAIAPEKDVRPGTPMRETPAVSD